MHLEYSAATLNVGSCLQCCHHNRRRFCLLTAGSSVDVANTKQESTSAVHKPAAFEICFFAHHNEKCRGILRGGSLVPRNNRPLHCLGLHASYLAFAAAAAVRAINVWARNLRHYSSRYGSITETCAATAPEQQHSLFCVVAISRLPPPLRPLRRPAHAAALLKKCDDTKSSKSKSIF